MANMYNNCNGLWRRISITLATSALLLLTACSDSSISGNQGTTTPTTPTNPSTPTNPNPPTTPTDPKFDTDIFKKIDEDIKATEAKLKDPTIPFETKSTGDVAELTPEDIARQQRLAQQQQLALYAEDPDPEWISTAVDMPLTIVKAGEHHQVQFTKLDIDGEPIGAVNPELLSFEMRLQLSEDDVRYIPEHQHSLYARWDTTTAGQLNVTVPAHLHQGRLLIAIRPKTEDAGERALTERWSQLATFELWQPKAGVSSLQADQVAFPRASGAELAPDSAFSLAEIQAAVRAQLEALVLPVPIVTYGTDYKLGDLIDYRVGQRPHAGRVRQVVNKNGQQLLILAPDLMNVYDILLGEDTAFEEMGLLPEHTVIRLGERLSKEGEAPAPLKYFGPKERSRIQSKTANWIREHVSCTGGVDLSLISIVLTPEFQIFGDKAGFQLKIAGSVIRANNQVECTLSFNRKFGNLLKRTPMSFLLNKVAGTDLTPSAIFNLKWSYVKSASGDYDASYEHTYGVWYKRGEGIDFEIKSDPKAYGGLSTDLKGSPVLVEQSFGGEAGVRVEANLLNIEHESDTLAGWLRRGMQLDLKMGLYGELITGISRSSQSYNAAAVYKNNDASGYVNSVKATAKVGASTDWAKIALMLGIKVDLNVSLSRSAEFKTAAKYKVTDQADYLNGNAKVAISKDYEDLNQLGNATGWSYEQDKDEESSVFNDVYNNITYDMAECEKKGTITAKFVGCDANGEFCGPADGALKLCTNVGITATKAQAQMGETAKDKTTITVSPAAKDAAVLGTVGVFVHGRPLRAEKVLNEIRPGASKELVTEAVCTTKGITEGEITAQIGVKGEPVVASNVLQCDCKQGTKDCDRVWGDPYLLTADGLAYDYLASGDYILQRVVDKDNKPIFGLEVQARFLPGYDVSWTHGAAVRIGSDVVEVLPAVLGHGRSSIGMEIKVNGSYLYPPAVNGTGGSYEPLLHSRLITLPGGGRIYIDSFVQQFFTHKPAKISLIWPRDGVFKGYGLTLSVPEGQFENPEPFLDFQFTRPDTYAGYERGLMGNNDGDPTNDLMRRNGQIIPIDNMTDRTQLYALFGGDWLAKGSECLFSDGCRTPQFPTSDIVLTPEQRVLGEYACGALTGFYREACIHDVGLTGNPELVKKAYENSDTLNYMASKIRLFNQDNGKRNGIYTAHWQRSMTLDQVVSVRANISHVQGEGGYQLMALPPAGATVRIDGKRTIKSVLANQDSALHHITVDCKVEDELYKDLGLDTYGRVQLWTLNPNTGLADAMISEMRLSCDSEQRMASGDAHHLLLDNDGQLWAWGENNKGQLGTGISQSDYRRYLPTQVVMPDSDVSRITHIAAGGNHSVALDDRGRLWAWGDNTYGQLGNGSNNYEKPEPVDMTLMDAAGVRIVWIAVGAEHSIALDNQGGLWAWGRNHMGQLGLGNRINKTTPTRVNTDMIDKSVAAIVAGANHTMALDREGGLWVWGDNSRTQLGMTGDNQLSPVRMPAPSSARAIAIATGALHSLMLDDTGAVWAWGDNSSGQLGLADLSAAHLPTKVAINATDDIASIGAGHHQSVAIDAKGQLYAWGNNALGQLGIQQSGGRQSTPTAVNFGAGTEKDIINAALGKNNMLMLDVDGYVYSTGGLANMSYHGQNHYHDGYGFANSNVPVPFSKLEGETEFLDFSINQANSTVKLDAMARPASVSGQLIVPLGYDEIVTGESDTLLGSIGRTSVSFRRAGQLQTDVLVKCVTYGAHHINYGLYDSNKQEAVAPNALNYTCYPDIETKWKVDHDTGDVYLLATNKSRLAGKTAFAVNQDSWSIELAPNITQEQLFSSLNCQQTAHVGQNHTIAMQMLMGATAYHDSSTIFYPKNSCGNGLIGAGSGHSLALSSKGRLWAWGYNSLGQLGYPVYHHYNQPVVVGLTNVLAMQLDELAVGAEHTVALDSASNTLWAWGDNIHGQLGDGKAFGSSARYHASPIKVDTSNMAGAQIVSVAAGVAHNIALDSTGKLWAWGNNSHGELGDGSFVAKSKPIAVDMSAFQSQNSVIAIAAGAHHSLALDDVGGLWAWGYNNYGQLGLPTIGFATKPVRVDTSAVSAVGAKLVNISAGIHHAIALDDKGNLWSWGNNGYGQLGVNDNEAHAGLIRVAMSPTQEKVKKIVAAGNHTLVLMHSGAVYAWGDNTLGALGLGDNDHRYIPTLLDQSDMGAVKILNITSGYNHSIALDNFGELWSWGHGAYGQLGNRANVSHTKPTKVYMYEIDRDNQQK